MTSSATRPAKTDYEHYLKIDRLLDLQQPLTPGAHDEMLFVIIHQAFELWFKLTLYEGDAAGAALSAGRTYDALRALRRVLTIFELLIQQLAVLETMSPDGFMRFRDPLAPASGFESFQFRELEVLLGYGARLDLGTIHEEHRATVAARLEQPDLYQALCEGMRGQGFQMPEQPEGRGQRLATLASIYRDHASPQRALVHAACELMVDIDEAFARWRFRHVQMAAREIGRRPGTGGSSGVAYLESTLGRRGFPELWDVRTEL